MLLAFWVPKIAKDEDKQNNILSVREVSGRRKGGMWEAYMGDVWEVYGGVREVYGSCMGGVQEALEGVWEARCVYGNQTCRRTLNPLG